MYEYQKYVFGCSARGERAAPKKKGGSKLPHSIEFRTISLANIILRWLAGQENLMEIFLKTAVRHSPVRTLNKVVRGWLKNLSSFVPRHFRRCEPTGILLGLPSPARKPEGLDCGV
jgi:hypothetical protein